ncbi:MAG: hypothetical protein KDB61_02825 [Planctomycetes bacterium]|nr:hypothetical protein [Planctomycetota bacterium]
MNIDMKKQRFLLMALAGLGLIGMQLGYALAAVAASPSGPLSNSHLDAHHPATLAGRADLRSTQYVDLYAPLTAKESARLQGYRGADGRPLPTPTGR